MSRFKIIRPGETLLIEEEWSDDPQWVDGENIISSEWDIGPAGPTLSGGTFAGTLSAITISNVSFGKEYALTNLVVAPGGKRFERSISLRCAGGT